jgi:hypothetical protein
VQDQARAVTGSGVERVPSPGGTCWICGLPAVCGEKLPGRRHKARALCQTHADAIFGVQDPPWRHLDARTQRDIVEEWLRGMTILAQGAAVRPADELLAEISAVSGTDAHMTRLVSPLTSGEARDLQESIRAQDRLRSRETVVHAVVTPDPARLARHRLRADPQRGTPAPGAEARCLA